MWSMGAMWSDLAFMSEGVDVVGVMLTRRMSLLASLKRNQPTFA